MLLMLESVVNVGWGKPRFGVKACTFCRVLETEHSDLKRGPGSVKVILALPLTSCH